LLNNLSDVQEQNQEQNMALYLFTPWDFIRVKLFSTGINRACISQTVTLWSDMFGNNYTTSL